MYRWFSVNGNTWCSQVEQVTMREVLHSPALTNFDQAFLESLTLIRGMFALVESGIENEIAL